MGMWMLGGKSRQATLAQLHQTSILQGQAVGLPFFFVRRNRK
jgi:hypothetical protein